MRPYLKSINIMNPPTCKLCKSPHWTYEAHKPTAALEEVRQVGAGVLGYEKRIVTFPDPNPPESVTTTTEGPLVFVPLNQTLNGRNKRTRGRPRKWASEAERKRAYRQRRSD